MVKAFLIAIEDKGDEGALDAAQTAAAHIRTLLQANTRDAATREAA